MATEITTARTPGLRAFASNSTSASLAALTGTVTKPTTGVLLLPIGDPANQLFVSPYGTDADAEAFTLRVTGWFSVGGLWMPYNLITVACILGDGTAKGVAGSLVTDNDFMAQSITFTSGTVTNEIHSLGDNTPAWFVCDAKGFELIQIEVDISGTPAAASANALYRGL